MKILFVVRQKKNVDTFLGTMRALLERGHTLALALQQRDERAASAIDDERFTVVACPPYRTDRWAGVAPLVRGLRDCVQYLQPDLRGAAKLRARTVHKLREELHMDRGVAEAFTAALQEVPATQVGLLETALGLAEGGLPTDPLYDEFIAAHEPDVLLLSPVVAFGAAQADLIASARRAGVPVFMLLFSWDNLSTKGYLHRQPDRMFVWNEQQREEAGRLHGFPAERVTVAGAPRFDPFFDLRPALAREQFHEPLGLDPGRPTLLYVCSSRFVSERELPFIERWLSQLRASGHAALRECNVVVRPHPDVALREDGAGEAHVRWPGEGSLTGHVARPFGDERALVLRTTHRSQQGFFECIAHSAAVVGLNTSAELEAGIVGRPVYTVRAAEQWASGQVQTVHFHYLLQEHGGMVSSARDLKEHVAQLERELEDPSDPAPIRAFVERFLRPRGIDRPVSPLLAEAIEAAVATTPPGEAPAAGPVSPGPPPMPSTPLPSARVDRRARPVIEEVDDGRSVAPLAYQPCRLTVYVTSEVARSLRKHGVHVDPHTADWLQEHVGIGDVVYDIGAGAGVYTLIAARHRGATVVAFEPGYAAYAHLCDNLLLNGCDGTVMPLPAAVGSGDVLARLKYRAGYPGEDRYALREDPWRVRPRAGEATYTQPVMATSLDAAVVRYGLPGPNHLRVSMSTPIDPVLDGAAATLAAPGVRSVCLVVTTREAGATGERLSALGWRPDVRARDTLSTVVAVRDGASRP